MASINGVSSSNMTSSLYNSANTISGLASGLDTEGMIENLVKSYQTKINQISQKVTKTEWKQEAYRSIISKMVGFTQKYTSYNSPATNLLSPGFFSSAVKILTKGTYADNVTASGKSSSDIVLNAVRQLATAAQYRVGDGLLNGGTNTNSSIQGKEMDLLGKTELGSLQGSLTITYGSNKVNINFDQVDDVKAMEEIRAKLEKDGKSATDADVLAGLIEQKLAGQKITFSNGKSENAEDRIKVTVKDGAISFSDKSTAGNTVYMSQASGNVEDVLGLDLDKASEKQPNEFKLNYDFNLTKEVDNIEYLSGKSMNLNLNGVTKTISLPTVEKVAGAAEGDPEVYKINGKEVSKEDLADEYAKAVNEEVGKVFKKKIEVTNTGKDGKLNLNFTVKEEGSDLLINCDVGETLGIGRTASTYLNTSSTLEKLLGDKLDTLETVKDKDGNDLLDDKGNKMYAFKLNGVTIGNYTKESKLSDIMNDINANKDAGVKVSYSQTTKNFTFTSKETGEDSEIVMGGGLAEAMFGSTEIPDNSGGSFAEAYGVGWLQDGASAEFKFEIPGSSLSFDITKESTIQDVIDNLNDSPMGMNHSFSYNKYTGQIEGVDKQTGEALDMKITDPYGDSVEFDESKAPAINYTPGQDAEFTVTVNGETLNMKRSSNSVNIDGLTINMNGVFDSTKDKDGNPITDPVQINKNVVTFESKTDSDKIVDAVKAMLEDYNAMISEIRSAYSTMPAKKSDGSSYEPLTSDQMSGYSESEQKNYEEKAKQGILFADRDLSRLYDKLRSVFSPAGEDGAILRGMGITTSYDMSTGALSVTLDEDKLRAMLDSDPDMVADAFTKTSGLGGVMQNMKTTLDTYAKTTGEPKGILIQKAGSPLSPLSLMDNTWQKQIDNYNKQIEKWQDKLSSQVDRYTQQFSRLEQLISQMNSQSSALMGMMGG